MNADNMRIMVSFDSSDLAEYDVPLKGIADIFEQALLVITSESFRGTAEGLPGVAIDRAAVRSMVEDHWRAFISVAATNPPIGAQDNYNFEDQIQGTAS